RAGASAPPAFHRARRAGRAPPGLDGTRHLTRGRRTALPRVPGVRPPPEFELARAHLCRLTPDRVLRSPEEAAVFLADRGVAHAHTRLRRVGYPLPRAESRDAAVKLVRAHPFLPRGGSLRVGEAVDQGARPGF